MHPRLQKLSLVASDLAAQLTAFLIGAFVLTVYGQYSSREAIEAWWFTTGEIHTLVHAFFIGLVLLRFYVKGLYSRRLPFWDELRLILATMGYLALLSGLVVLIAKWPFSRSLWLASWTSAAVLIPLFRSWTRRFLLARGAWNLATVIIGTGDTAASTSKALMSEPHLGYRIIRFLALADSKEERRTPASIPIQTVSRENLLRELDDLTDEHPHLQIILALDQADTHVASELLEKLGLHFPHIHMVPPLGGLPLFGLEANHFFSHEVLLLRSKNNLGFRPQYLLKRIFDLVAATTLLILLSPLLAFIALRIRRSGPGVLFKQPRWGHRGEKFLCYKFRTMVPDAEKVLKDLLERDPVARREWQEKTKITHDPRVTPIGEFLRRTSLDELPQLINVIKGEMSLVGPRPILLHELEKYGSRFDFYRNVRPGITGLWQVSGRSDTDYANRIHLDTWYVKNWSLWYDIAILFKTITVVLSRRGAY